VAVFNNTLSSTQARYHSNMRDLLHAAVINNQHARSPPDQETFTSIHSPVYTALNSSTLLHAAPRCSLLRFSSPASDPPNKDNNQTFVTACSTRIKNELLYTHEFWSWVIITRISMLAASPQHQAIQVVRLSSSSGFERFSLQMLHAAASRSFLQTTIYA
jgi:hypothetical protein